MRHASTAQVTRLFPEKDLEKKTHKEVSTEEPSTFFDKQAETRLLKPLEVAQRFGISISTIYDWKYRGEKKGVPKELFFKINRMLFLRSDVLENWLISQNSYEE